MTSIQAALISSLDGNCANIARLVHALKKDDYLSLSPTKSRWLRYDGLLWQHSEVGIWEVLSTDVVNYYEANVDVMNKKQLDNVVFKLKHACYKETICKLCYALFYDPHKLEQLNKSVNLVCFKNGILNTKTGKFFRKGKRSWYMSLWIDNDYNPQDVERMQQLIEGYEASRTKSRIHQLKQRNAADHQVRNNKQVCEV